MLLYRPDLVCGKDLGGLAGVAKAPAGLGHDAHELWGHAVDDQLVIGAEAFDVEEFIFGGDFGDGD